MSAVGYCIAGVLVVLGVILAGGILGGLRFAINAMRPELLEKPPREGD